MKRFILSTLLSLISLAMFAQMHDHSDGLQCSHVKSFYNSFKSTKDVIQTPLLNDYDVKFYFLDLNVESNTITISGEVTFYAEVVAAELDTFAFELIEQMTIDEVVVNGIAQSVFHTTDEAFVPLTESIAEGSLFTAKITYHGTPPTGGFFSGISTGTGWDKNVTWTLSEPFAARDWWPTKQVLEDKADSAWIFLTTSNENMAGSNGLLTNITSMPGNKLRYEWKTNYPIDYYLISFAVSDYQDYSIYSHPAQMGGDSLLIQNFIYDSPGCLENYQDGIDQTAEFIELFSDLYSLYPFHEEKYGHCLTPLGGGMEHQTMTTIGGFSFGLVAHELGHMWFGDHITCATWSDIWINEGFATYTDYLANEFILGQGAANTKMQGIHNSVMSAPDGSVYVPPAEVTYDNVWRIFDGRLSYNKGAAILHMIRFELQNDDLFFQVLKDYLNIYGDSVATGLDFMNVLNETSGMDFNDFFNQWYFGEGYPTYSIIWSQNDNGMYMEITQTSSAPAITPLFKMLMGYKLLFYDGTDTIIYLHQTENVNNFSIPITNDVGLIQIDPDNWVVNQVGSISVNVDENFIEKDFTLAPNPTNGVLNLFFADEVPQIREIYILDLFGNKIKSEKTELLQFSINIADIPSGSYICKVRSGKNQYFKKFVKVD
jgi:aminopeptidase N